jgi:lauroyl/myristoyl acyltransferase
MNRRAIDSESRRTTTAAATPMGIGSETRSEQRKDKRKLVALNDLYLLLALALVKATSRCSCDKAGNWLGRVIGLTAFLISRRKRLLASRSLSRVLGLRDAEMQRALRGSFICFWQDAFSHPPSRRSGAVQNVPRFRGRRYLEEALARQKGVILWESSSLGKRYLAKRILYENGFPVCQVHSENHIGGFQNSQSRVTARLIRPLFQHHEKAFVKELLILSSSDSLRCAREFLERLRRNEIICISADGRIGSKFMPITFLGRSDAFPTGIASLARASGATILPLFCVEESPGEPSLVIEPPIQMDPQRDRDSSVERAIMQYISLADLYIRRYPEQYRGWNALNSADQPT